MHDKSEDAPPVVLASTSRYRTALIEQLRLTFTVMAPEFDERSSDRYFDPDSPEEHALLLARGKAMSVASKLNDEVGSSVDHVVIGADQIAVLRHGSTQHLLHKATDASSAIEQLMTMSGTSHRLINGLVVVHTGTGTTLSAVDHHVITMRPYSRDEAAEYVHSFEPFDCVGSYRIEDDADLIAKVEGGHQSGIVGLPLPTLCTLLATFGVHTAWNDSTD